MVMACIIFEQHRKLISTLTVKIVECMYDVENKIIEIERTYIN